MATITGSNPFLTSNEKNGSYWNLDDLLIPTSAEDLTKTKDSDLLKVDIVLKRRHYNDNKKPNGYKTSSDILNLNYDDQVKFTNSLLPGNLKKWYGASRAEIKLIKNYILKHSPDSQIKSSRKKRLVEFKINAGDFKSAFLEDNNSLLYNIDGYIFWGDGIKTHDSSLSISEVKSAEKIAKSILGITVHLENDDNPNNNQELNNHTNTGNNKPIDSSDPIVNKNNGEFYMYYPQEVADFYDFPNLTKTGGGKGVTIGLMGSGGNRFKKVLGRNNIFNQYLQEQGINTDKLGKLKYTKDAKNTKESESSKKENEGYYGESAMDYSILRSIAPYADLKISSMDNNLYKQYSELIYDDDVDIISSSVGDSGITPFYAMNQADQYNELFLDGVLRGKTIVVSSGDRGIGNYNEFVPLGPSPSYLLGSPSILSVGGTAFSQKIENLNQKRAMIKNPTYVAPSLTSTQIDQITGYMDEQVTWNQLSPFSGTISPFSVYPTFASKLGPRNFINPSTQQYFTTYRQDILYTNQLTSSGKFSSSDVPMPSYQSNFLDKKWVKSDDGRRYPDIAMLAGSNTQSGSESFFYSLSAFYDDKKADWIPEIHLGGGTSASAPLTAGLLATIQSSLQKGKDSKVKLGLVNSYLYQLHADEDWSGIVFNDVSQPSNNDNSFIVSSDDLDAAMLMSNGWLMPLKQDPHPKISNVYAGYDGPTGLGSLNGNGLLDAMTNLFETIS